MARRGVRLPRRPKQQHNPNQLQFEFGEALAVHEGHRVAPRPERAFSKGANLRALSAPRPDEELPNLLSFDSSRVAEAGYSSESKTLYVRFVDGTPWQYNGVEQNVWRNFRRSASPGRFINRVLNNHSYNRSNF